MKKRHSEEQIIRILREAELHATLKALEES